MDELFDFADVQPETLQDENIPGDMDTDGANPDGGETAAIPDADGQNTVSEDAGVSEGIPSDEAAPLSEGAEDEPEGEAEVPPTPVVRAKYNKQVRELTVEDAAPYVEMGMKWEEFRPVHEKLRYLSEAGGRSVEQMIDGLIEASEQGLYAKALEEAGGNETTARKLAEYQIAEARKRFEDTKVREESTAKAESEAEKEDALKRLADGFSELKRETGGKFKEVSEVPKQVMDLATDKGISLFDAYLRYERKQAQATNAEQTRREKAARQSSGALAGGGDAPANQDAENFAAAFGSVWS